MRTVLTAISLAALLGFGSSVTSGAPPSKPTLLAPAITCGTSTENTITLTITAATPYGAPYGFSIHWTTCEALAANGGVWPAESCGASFSGNASGAYFAMGAGDTVEVTIGDLGSDPRPGVSWECDDDLLACGTCYAFRTMAHGGASYGVSDKLTPPVQCNTSACGETTCGTGFAKGDDEQTSVFYSGHGNPDDLDALSTGNGRWGWALNIPAADGETVTDLWVGAGGNDTANATLAGTVTITVAGNQVTVAYDLDGYSLDQVHIYASDLKPIAINGATNQVKAPGGYGHTAGDPDADGYSYTFTLTDTNGDGFWIIAHAVVCGVPVDQPDDE